MTNISNRFNNHGNGIIVVLFFILAVIGISYLESWWLQSILLAFTKVEYSMWIMFAVLVLTSLFTPKNLQGLPLFLMFLAQCYIWFFMV